MNKSTQFEIIIIALIGIMAYGLQIPWLGFFQDDWNFVYYYSLNGPQGLMELMTIDGRPGGVWVYVLGFGILGYNPALWQMFSIFFRILTAITALLILNRLWPERRYGNLIASVLFLVYPFFTLQPLAVSFAQHHVAYFLFGLSILFMIRAIEAPDKYLRYSIPAILCTVTQLFTVEYFVGLELLRPLIIWTFISRGREIAGNKKLRTTILNWLPYLLLLVFFVLWRSVYLASFGVRNDPLSALTDSGEVILSVVRNAGADMVLMLISSWFKLISPELFVLGPIRNLYVLASAVIGGICFHTLSKFVAPGDKNNIAAIRVFLVGGLIIAAGMIPAYAIGYILNVKLPPWNSRFSLPALLGLALIISELITVVITSNKTRLIFLSVLLGLVIGHHNYNMLTFKSVWEKQERLYQQMVWRAPSLSPGTAIVADQEILAYMGDYPTSFAINTLYPLNSGNNVPYWFFALSENLNVDTVSNNKPLTASKASMSFHGNSKEAIFIIYEPENKQCLWVLRPEDAEYKHLPAAMKNIVRYANLSLIHNEEISRHVYDQIVRENKETWCFFYQKADLARQEENWATAIQLWEEAQNNGYHPDNAFEYIVFIESYAHAGDWEKAFQLTKTANKITEAMYFILCPTWQRLDETTPAFSTKDEFVEKAYGYLECAPLN